MRIANDPVRRRESEGHVSAALSASIALVAALFASSGMASPARQEAVAVGGYIWAGTPAQTRAARAAGNRDAKARVRAARPHDRSHPALGHVVAEHRRPGHGTPDRQDVWVEGRSLRPELRPAEGRAVRDVHRRAESERHFLRQHEHRRDGFRLQGCGYKGIPWISVVSGVVPARGLYDYGTNGFALAKIIDTYLIKTMRAKGGTKPHKLFAIGAPTVGVASANSSKQLERDVAAAGDVQLINHDLDLSNAVQDTLSTSRQALQQNPDLAGHVDAVRLLPAAHGPGGRQGTDRNPHDCRGRLVREPAGDRTASATDRSTPCPTFPGCRPCGSGWIRSCKTSHARPHRQHPGRLRQVPAPVHATVRDRASERRQLRSRHSGLRAGLPDLLHDQVEERVPHEIGHALRGRADAMEASARPTSVGSLECEQ